MQKWEYCEVDCRFGNAVTLRYYRPNGSLVHGPEKVRNDDAARERAKQIVADLGLQGWELVNVRENGWEYWLKRPLEG